MIRSKRRPYRSQSPEAVTARMRRIRRQHTAPEILLRRALWRSGVRYRLHDARLPGKPDLVLAKARTLIFVDGDYWHGRILLESGRRALRTSFRGPRSAYWVSRIVRNVTRDQIQTDNLLASGWSVIRVWEQTVRTNLDATVEKILKILNRNSRRPPTFLRL